MNRSGTKWLSEEKACPLAFSSGIEKKGCPRRRLCQEVFGQGFDSPRIHQKKSPHGLFFLGGSEGSDRRLAWRLLLRSNQSPRTARDGFSERTAHTVAAREKPCRGNAPRFPRVQIPPTKKRAHTGSFFLVDPRGRLSKLTRFRKPSEHIPCSVFSRRQKTCR